MLCSCPSSTAEEKRQRRLIKRATADLRPIAIFRGELEKSLEADRKVDRYLIRSAIPGGDPGVYPG